MRSKFLTHIIIDDYGVQLEKSENMFLLKRGEQQRRISALKVTAIHVYKTATISSAAIMLAAENDIPLLFYDTHFKPVARIWNSNFSITGLVRVMQPLFCKRLKRNGCVIFMLNRSERVSSNLH